MEPGQTVKALFDFTTDEPNELPLTAGDVVTVTQKVDSNWLIGTCNGQTGSFPVNFVELYGVDTGIDAGSNVITADSLNGSHHVDHNTDSFLVRALKDNDGQLVDELSFKKDDIITIVEKIDDDWWRGELNGKSGILPSICVEMCNDDGAKQIHQEAGLIAQKDGLNKSSPVKAEQPWARALYPFSAEQEGELSFMDDEEINLRKRVNDSWLEGEIQGKVGIFPSNFVQIMVDIPEGYQPPPLPITTKQSNQSLQPQDKQLHLPDMLHPPEDTHWKGKRAKVLFDFTAENEEDLPVKQGEIITVIARPDDEWFEAKHPSGRHGFIPANYLQVLSKPKSPSSKRKAPAPPAKDKNHNGQENTIFSADEFDSLAGISSKNTSKPALPPKPKSLSSPSKALDDLLCFDPIFDSAPPVAPLKPAQIPLHPEKPPAQVPLQPEKPPLQPEKPPLEPVSPPLLPEKPPFQSEKPPVPSKPDFKALSPKSPPGNLMDEHIGTAPEASAVPEGDILQPTSTASDGERAVSPPMTNYQVYTPKPFSASVGSNQIRKIQSPVPVSPTHDKEVGILTLDDISKDFDKALDGSLVSDDNLPPPLPPRQPSPNPFAKEDPETPASTSNPFSAVEKDESILPGGLPPLGSPPLQGDVPSNLTEGPSIDDIFPTSMLPRDDSVTSDLSDDTFFQNISVTINPSPMQLSPQSSDAFKLPPPPSKGAVTGKPAVFPKPQKFDSKSAVPRPRGRLSTSDNSVVSSNGNGFAPLAPPPIASRQEVAAFEASVEDIFSNKELEQIQPPEKKHSLLEQDLGVIGQAVRESSSHPANEAVADLLGVEGMAPEKPPPRKKPPPRPSPPKVAPVANVSREDAILAHLRPEAAGSSVAEEEPGVELQDTLSSLQASIAEYKLEIQRGRDQKRKLEGLLTSSVDEERMEIEQQIADTGGNLQHLEQELNTLQAQLNDLQPDQLQLVKKKNAEFRNKVIKEVLKTETLYVRDIKLCQKGFMTVLEEKQDEINEILYRQTIDDGDPRDKKTARGLELDILFGNMEEVIMVAENFMNDLASTVEEKPPEEQFIGECFMNHSSDLHKAYATYCRNHDDAIALLEKYEENPEVQEYINQGLELVRQSTNCWDLASFLIKPVQRILKYHLLLAELYKYTEEDHPDRPNIQKALTAMTDVANSINEFKRRKDLVMKYRNPEQEAISDKIGKINLHSIRKKSQRMNQKFTRITGLTTQTVDEEFDKMERRFRVIEKTIKIFVTDINSYLEQLKTATSAEATVGSDISDYYASQSNLHEVNKYEAAQRHLANKLYKDYTLFVQQRVLSPLESLLNMFQGPHKLIQKRHHKLLDYDSCINKVEKTKDKDKLKLSKGKDKLEKLAESDEEENHSASVGSPQRLKEKKPKEVKDEKEVARKNYEAMNIQLKDEMPKLCQMSLAIFKSCVVSFVEAERDHINSTLKKIYPLLELSIVQNSDLSDILLAFESNHQQAVERQYHFSFVPNNFDKKDKLDRRLSRRSTQPGLPPSKPQPNKNNNQSESQRSKLEKRYPPDRLGVVKETFRAKEPMDISLSKGDLVAIIKQQDPSGGGDRWYVDNGASQGFVPSSLLALQGKKEQGIDSFEGSDEEQPQYYYAEWSFEASGANELSMEAGMVVRLVSAQDVDGNSEWWLVAHEGQQGYVPGNYLARIP